MKLTRVELRWVRLPLVTPFRTTFGTELDRRALMVRAVGPEADGWGECVAMPEPSYSAEYLDGAADVLRRFLIPAVKRLPAVTVNEAEKAFNEVRGHPMAKASLLTAILDAELRLKEESLAKYLGATRDAVPAGVSVGVMDTVDELLAAVERYLDEGYQRIKLKIEPGWDIEPVSAVRDRFGSIPLQVDANGAYRPADVKHLCKLDAFDLLMIEQPLDEDDLRAHATLARQLNTPICLDEPITSARTAAAAITMGAAQVINIKPGRVGGYLEARRIHDVCQAHGVPVWVGGMVETGIGRAPNLALAALPNCTLVGDISASSRFFSRDITAPFTMRNGYIEVPTGPGIGVEPAWDALEEATVDFDTISF